MFWFDMLSLLKRSFVVGLEHRPAVFERSGFAAGADPWTVEVVEPVSSVSKTQDH